MFGKNVKLYTYLFGAYTSRIVTTSNMHVEGTYFDFLVKVITS